MILNLNLMGQKWKKHDQRLPGAVERFKRCSFKGVLTEHSLIIDVFDTEPEACREGAHQDVEVEEEGDPGGGLVLRHRGDDGDVDLRVAAHREGGRGNGM